MGNRSASDSGQCIYVQIAERWIPISCVTIYSHPAARRVTCGRDWSNIEARQHEGHSSASVAGAAQPCHPGADRTSSPPRRPDREQPAADSVARSRRHSCSTRSGSSTSASPATNTSRITDSVPAGWDQCPLHELTESDRPITYGVVKPGPEDEDGIRSSCAVATYWQEELQSRRSAQSRDPSRNSISGTLLRGGKELFSFSGRREPRRGRERLPLVKLSGTTLPGRLE